MCQHFELECQRRSLLVSFVVYLAVHSSFNTLSYNVLAQLSMHAVLHDYHALCNCYRVMVNRSINGKSLIQVKVCNNIYLGQQKQGARGAIKVCALRNCMQHTFL